MRASTGPALALLLVAAACAATPDPVSMTHATVRFVPDNGTAATLDVRLADTFAERQQGLSGVEHLAENAGMAFVFSQPTADTFWMKDTLIPLSVAFVGTDGTIAAIRAMTPCTVEPCPTYAPPEPYALAIEASPEWFTSNGIGPGAVATFEGT